MSGDTNDCEIRKYIAIPESEYDALQARVRELEAKIALMDDQNKEAFFIIGENARLKEKLAEKHTHERCYALHDAILERDSLLKVVDAAREYSSASVTDAFYSHKKLIDSIRELDGVRTNDTNGEKIELSK